MEWSLLPFRRLTPKRPAFQTSSFHYEGHSLAELRVSPQRLTTQVVAFLDQVWESAPGASPEAVV